MEQKETWSGDKQLISQALPSMINSTLNATRDNDSQRALYITAERTESYSNTQDELLVAPPLDNVQASNLPSSASQALHAYEDFDSPEGLGTPDNQLVPFHAEQFRYDQYISLVG